LSRQAERISGGDYATATAKFVVNACANADFAFVMKFALITLMSD